MIRLVILAVTFLVSLALTSETPSAQKSILQGFQEDLNQAREPRRPAHRPSSRFTRIERFEIQASLNERGYNVGRPDSVFGRRTRAGIAAFQRDIGERPTGILTRGQADILLGLAPVQDAENDDGTDGDPIAEKAEPETMKADQAPAKRAGDDGRMDIVGIAPGQSLTDTEQAIRDRMDVTLALDGTVAGDEPLFGALRLLGDEAKGEAFVLLHAPDGEQRTVVGIARVLYTALNGFPNEDLEAALVDKYGKPDREDRRENAGTYLLWFDGAVTPDPNAEYGLCGHDGGGGFTVTWAEDGAPVDWEAKTKDAGALGVLFDSDGPNVPDFAALYGDMARAHLDDNAKSCFVAGQAALNTLRESDGRDSLIVTLIDFAWYQALKAVASETETSDAGADGSDGKSLDLDL